MTTVLTEQERKTWSRHLLKVFGQNQDIANALLADYLREPAGFRSKSANRLQRFVINHKGEVQGYLGCPPVPIGEPPAESISNFLVTDTDIDEFVDHCVAHKLNPMGVADMVLRIPNPLLFSKIEPLYHLYKIMFIPEQGDRTEPSMQAVWNGYYGITSRSPLERFREHQRDAMSGKGHLLHRTWRALMLAQPKSTVVMTIAGHSNTLKGIYGLEERFVYAETLNPKGLNAIPGGEAGLKVMHQLAVLKNGRMIDVEHRDAALVRLDNQQSFSKCTHYRRGHIRKLANGRLTWVSPCWINKETGDTAMAA